MVINHNLGANNALRNMNINSGSAGKSMQKLSSGLRINTAGDDAAGLAISEKMRGQIRGLDQASSNAQDGISMIQTGEGALSETTSILQRMRELAVQGSNGTLNDTDRGQIQKEMDQLISEIDRIGNTTEFNTKTLLNGSQAQSVSLKADQTKVLKAEVVTDTDKGTYQLTVSDKAIVAADTGFTDGNTGVKAADLGTFGTNFNVKETYEIQISDNASDNSHKDITLKKGDGTIIKTVTDQKVDEDITIGDGDNTLVIAKNTISHSGKIGFKVGVSAKYEVKNITTNVTKEKTVTSTDGKVDLGAFQLTIDKNLTNNTDAAAFNVTGEAVKMQIGANENQTMTISMRDMRAEALGVDKIDVMSAKNATQAITTIQSAIDTVSTERSKLGAYSNRLEHTIANLGTSSENMTSAESRIRDVDMAKEMSNYSKNNILSQAAQAMLAQANQQPQQVLQLLR